MERLKFFIAGALIAAVAVWFSKPAEVREKIVQVAAQGAAKSEAVKKTKKLKTNADGSTELTEVEETKSNGLSLNLNGLFSERVEKNTSAGVFAMAEFSDVKTYKGYSLGAFYGYGVAAVNLDSSNKFKSVNVGIIITR